MKFLDAHRLVQEFEGGREIRFRLGMSGTAEPLLLYLKAAGAERGLSIRPEFGPFGTLRQSVLAGPATGGSGEPERWILMPWDFIPELDWRTGIPEESGLAGQLEGEARGFIEGFGERRFGEAFYLPAAVPPIHAHPEETASVARFVLREAAERGAVVWAPRRFSLSSYLSSGFPLASGELGAVAREVVASVAGPAAEPKKVLVTDLDGVLWHGVIGDDGPEGVECGPEGRGYRHFLYQTFLRKLRREGAIVVALSRNDPAVVEAAFQRADLTVAKDDFVSILATYGAKSACVRQLSQELNLGLDAFVFVDDNPVELAEVGEQLREVETVPFPASTEELSRFLDRLAGLFAKRGITREDRERTAYYRRTLAGLTPSVSEGADLTTFLEGLGMVLRIHDRTAGNRDRAVQLINKTNQFNLNGIRRSDAEVAGLLGDGGRLLGASLRDRTGDHGEILSCLIDEEGRVRSLVLSCRVFQRRVEHAFLHWLTREGGAIGELEFRVTERNEPLRSFLSRLGTTLPEKEGWVRLPARVGQSTEEQARGLFRFEGP